MPELEAWQQVIITGNNGTRFLESVHGPDYDGDLHHPLSCQHCHGGQPDGTFTSMDEAHAGLIPDPSAFGDSGCTVCHDGSDSVGQLRSACDHCHADIVTRTANSLHTTLQGYITSIEDRGGMLTEDHQQWFDARCASCHTTCGQCHITRPKSVGGGFVLRGGVSLGSHRFYETPDMNEQCTACHGTRVGDDFQGTLTGTPDIHFSRGMRCVACHSGDELHGDGTQYNHRYEVAGMPECVDCHSDDVVVNTSSSCTTCHVDPEDMSVTVVAMADVHHAHHVADSSTCSHCHRPPDNDVSGMSLPNMQCQACHSQQYKNCTNCHDHQLGGGHGYTVETPTIQFKLARNSNPNRDEYDVTVVRHIPIDPETYANWGPNGLDLPDFAAKPTWMYSSPHNILRSTPQTAPVEGQSCAYSCHQSPTGPDGFLLREADLPVDKPLIYEANIDYVIPDAFPSRQ